ncbi:MAG: nicotinate (nicotinamide) nucleotide adenylyltransferase [Proteobacteria bacterium]|nr:nicotinate (nicotinamide) nucleotide adenylyltransferase [Pseudomonadota bacterium]
MRSGYRRIGLLGGSFNPAHEGHVHISRFALARLGLDEVWWLVSPQNPLKNPNDLADYALRLASARQAAAGVRGIRVTDIERRLGTRYTYQTVAALKARFPGVQFVWMMGADNLAQFHRWRRWRQILRSLPVVVFDRAPHSHRALRSPTALMLRGSMLKLQDIGPKWPDAGLLYAPLRRDPASSTEIRKTLGAGAFLRHNEVV